MAGWVVATESLQPAMPKIFTIHPLPVFCHGTENSNSKHNPSVGILPVWLLYLTVLRCPCIMLMHPAHLKYTRLKGLLTPGLNHGKSFTEIICPSVHAHEGMNTHLKHWWILLEKDWVENKCLQMKALSPIYLPTCLPTIYQCMFQLCHAPLFILVMAVKNKLLKIYV